MTRRTPSTLVQPTVDDTDPSALSPIGKLVKAVRFVKYAHSKQLQPSVNEHGGYAGYEVIGYTVSAATFRELMEALDGVEQHATGINLQDVFDQLHVVAD